MASIIHVIENYIYPQFRIRSNPRHECLPPTRPTQSQQWQPTSTRCTPGGTVNEAHRDVVVLGENFNFGVEEDGVACCGGEDVWWHGLAGYVSEGVK